MAGSIWTLVEGEEDGTKYSPGSQASYNAAKAVVDAAGGLFQVGPNDVALTLGVFPPNKVTQVRITKLGELYIGGLHVADNQDPTKTIHLAVAAISTGVERTVEFMDWSGIVPLPLDLGTAGKFLRSNGAAVQPSWETIVLTNALLDGVNHSDTVAQAVARGALIVGNSTPKWDRLAIGAAGTVLTSNGTDPAWSANPAVQHDTLAHIQPFSAANCNWTGATTRITTSGNAFSNVKVGDFVYVGTGFATSGNQGKRVAIWNDANSIDVDTAKSGSDLVNGTIWFVPGDHWNDTADPDSTGTGMGYMLASGRGNFTRSGGTTFQELRGPIRWLGHANGSISTDMRVQGSTSAAGGAYFGFSIWKSTTAGVYFMVNNLTADRVLTVPNDSGEICVISTTQTLTNKTLTTGNVLRMDETGGTTNGTAFRDRAGTTKGLGFDLTAITAGANRVAAWKDYGGVVAVATGEGTSGQVLTSNGAGSAPSYQTIAAPVVAACSSQHTVASATGTEVTDLSKTLVAGTYRFQYHLICQTTSTTVGIGFAINYTGTATKIVYRLIWTDTATTGTLTGTADDVANASTGNLTASACSKAEDTTAATVSCGGFATANSDTLLTIEGTVVVSDGGDLELWHASESATQTSVEVGSNLILTRIV